MGVARAWRVVILLRGIGRAEEGGRLLSRTTGDAVVTGVPADPGAVAAARVPGWRRLARWALSIGVLAGLAWLFRSRFDVAALGRALAGADYRLVLVCAVGHMALLHPLKAWRWSLMLAPTRRIPVRTLYGYGLAGCAATNVLPARAGQAVRVLLVRRHAVPVTAAVGVVVLEEMLNTAVLVLLALPLPFLLELSGRTRLAMGLVGAGAFLGLGVALVVALAGRGRRGVLGRVAEGVALLRDGPAALRVLAQTLVLWTADAAQIVLLMVALGMPPSWPGATLVLLFVNLANAVPVTPGQLGLFEGAAAAACMAVGASPERGLALGVLYHMMQVIPETAWGSVVLARASLGPLAARAEGASTR